MTLLLLVLILSSFLGIELIRPIRSHQREVSCWLVHQVRCRFQCQMLRTSKVGTTNGMQRHNYNG